jgi:hypothetical protein
MPESKAETWMCAGAGFLDNVCTDIIHYENKQLVLYPGNLSAFVKARALGQFSLLPMLAATMPG